ncbi:GRIP1-associated protein 1-like isoform X2 [Watersipora subatra]
MRLTAENTALQTNIGDIKQKFESELKLLRSAVEGVDITESDAGAIENPDMSLSNLIQESELLTKYNDVKLSLDTASAENKLLHERLDELKKSSSAEASDQLREKLKKKQESYVSLQNEKETLFAESSERIQSLEEARQRDIKNFQGQIERLNEDLRRAKEEAQNTQKQCEQRVHDLETTINFLKSKIDENSIKRLEHAHQENERFRAELEAVNAKLTDKQSELSEVSNKLEESEGVVVDQTQRLEALKLDLNNTEQQLSEKTRAAEKRKKLLDELAIKSQEDSDSYKSKLAQIELAHKQQLESLKTSQSTKIAEICEVLDKEKNKAGQADKLKAEVIALNERCVSLEEAKGWLRRSLDESEKKLSNNLTTYESEKENLHAEHVQAMADLREEHKMSIKALEDQLSGKNSELEDSQMETKKVRVERDALQQKVFDNKQEMKLHEKKGAGLMKDLKRQLAQERKRADRLEVRIQEINSSEPKLRQQSSEPFFLPIDSERLSIRADDASSVSSWSGANYSQTGNSVNRETSIHSMAREPTPRTSPSQSAEHDTQSLLAVVESLQKEKTSLSERVSMLEQSNSAMAEDLLKKQSIIEHYTMEGKEYVSSTPKKMEKMTLKRVVDFVKDKGDEGLNEKYRKCQRMLEETLTKNMCLQNDLEELSKQLAETKISRSQI